MLLLYSFIAVMLQLHFSPKISNMCSLGHIDRGGISGAFLELFTSRFTSPVMSIMKVYVPNSTLEHVQEGCSCVA